MVEGAGRDRAGSAQTVELTGKRWKALQLAGCTSLLLGFIVLGVGLAFVDSSRVLGVLLTSLVGLGAVLWVVGRVGAWWHHG